MRLANYFDNVKGIGILGTADPDGYLVQFKVDEVRPLVKEHAPAVGTTSGPT